MNRSLVHCILVVAASLGFFTSGSAATSGPVVGTLTLDGLSFISFENLENYTIPSGASIKFHFGAPNASGTIPFTIGPADLTIPPIPLRSGSGGGTIQYALASPASGTLQYSGGTATIDLAVAVVATYAGPQGGGRTTYQLHFTTQQATATNATGTNTVSISGEALQRSARYVQLVTATRNAANANPEPGKAVYSVLSGTFDVLP